MKGLPPKISKETEILILGTAPGLESLEKGEYYQDSRNRMKKILELVSEDTLKKIGFWDVFKSFKSIKESSLDKNRLFDLINDFDKEIFEKCSKLKIIIFNGKSKGSKRLFNKFLEKYNKNLKERNINHYCLASTSGSNPYFSQKEWLDILNRSL
ncbi:MAG: uracil-DNA glycosylase family protein [Candidatus Pacearchaeota archaeon]|jgi:hypoxanthine-DNA glycosylase